MNASPNHFKVLVTLCFVVSLAACAHKKVASSEESSASEVTEQNVMDPSIESNKPIQFESQGSDSNKIDGLSTVHFDFDRSTISTSDRALLSQNAKWLKNHPGVTLQIEGHCDARGSVEYNLALGERRAKAVFNMMRGMGIDSARMTTISYGEERPLVTGDSEDVYAKNRRANFVPMNAPVNQLSSNQ